MCAGTAGAMGSITTAVRIRAAAQPMMSGSSRAVSALEAVGLERQQEEARLVDAVARPVDESHEPSTRVKVLWS